MATALQLLVTVVLHARLRLPRLAPKLTRTSMRKSLSSVLYCFMSRVVSNKPPMNDSTWDLHQAPCHHDDVATAQQRSRTGQDRAGQGDEVGGCVGERACVRACV